MVSGKYLSGDNALSCTQVMPLADGGISSKRGRAPSYDPRGLAAPNSVGSQTAASPADPAD
jgi:hypothetical protein